MKRLIPCLTLFFLAAFLEAAEPGVLPLQVTKNLKLVYQVSDDASHDGINRGLFYVRKLIDTYAREGIPAGEVDFHVVYHGAGLHAVVNDTARARLTPEQTGNPNVAVLADLINRGVKIKICADTMRQKQVVAAELQPGVQPVVGAYPRLVDLQLQGYAYIKFE